MSKYAEYRCDKIRKQELLLAALDRCGYTADKVEVHVKPVRLVGYEGKRRQEEAHVIIRRQNTGIGMSNDIGFVRGADGVFRAIVSEYDQGSLRVTLDGQRLPFVQAVQKAYAAVTADKAVRTILMTTIPRMKQQGLLPQNATVRRVTEGTVTRIVATA